MFDINKHTPETAGWVSIIVNLFLFAIKLWAGIASASIALVADAWHTLTDSISSVFVVVGTRISNKPADKEHPFGHGRSELITAILIGGFLTLVGWSFMTTGFERFQTQQPANYGWIAILVTVVSILVQEGLTQYAFRIGKHYQSGAVTADAWHHRSDAISSVVVLVGVLLGRYFWWIDAMLAMVVSLMIFWTAFAVIRDAAEVILGEEPSNELIDKIVYIAESAAQRHLHAHHFHVHNYVNHKELTFHLRLPNDMTIAESHNIVTHIEKEIKAQTQLVATIHVEPIEVFATINSHSQITPSKHVQLP
jgi:cation diffusion facilitator family transporter